MRPKKLPKCIILPSEMYSDTIKTLSKTYKERCFINAAYLCRQKSLTTKNNKYETKDSIINDGDADGVE